MKEVIKMIRTEQVFETLRCREVLRDNATLLIGEGSFTEEEIDNTMANIRGMAELLFFRFGVQMFLVDALEDDDGRRENEKNQHCKPADAPLRITLNLHSRNNERHRHISGSMPRDHETEANRR